MMCSGTWFQSKGFGALSSKFLPQLQWNTVRRSSINRVHVWDIPKEQYASAKQGHFISRQIGNTYIILHQFFSAGESLLHNFSIHFLAELLRLEKIVLWVAGLFWIVFHRDYTTWDPFICLYFCCKIEHALRGEVPDTCTCIQGIWSRILQAADRCSPGT